MLMTHFNAAAETAVIGAVLRDKTAYDKVSSIVKADDFAVEANRLMYAAMENMIMHGQPVDPITLSSELDSRGELSAVGGLAAIGEVYGGYSTPNPHRYAETVRDLSRERAMLIAINDAHAMLHGTGDTQEKLASVAEVVMSAAETGQHDVHVTSARDMSQSALKAIIERSEAGEEGLSLGFVDVERMTGKLKAGQLIIIAGRPGMGKSTLARNIAEHVAAQTGVLFVSLEMDADELSECFIASLGHASHAAIQEGNTEGDHASGIARGATKLGDLKLAVATSADTLPAIHSLARTEARRVGSIGLIVVDYLQQLHVPGAKDRRVEVDEISRGLKRLAMTLRCPVIALAQLSRSVEQRADKRPLLSDLRESGGIEADADKVIMLYRDEYYNTESPHKGMAEVMVAKNRRGKCGKVLLAFIGGESRFADAAHGYNFDTPAEKPTRTAKGFN